MKNKNNVQRAYDRSLSRKDLIDTYELSESTGEFVDWLLDTIRDRMYTCSKLKDFKGMGQLNTLLDDINVKLEEE